MAFSVIKIISDIDKYNITFFIIKHFFQFIRMKAASMINYHINCLLRC